MCINHSSCIHSFITHHAHSFIHHSAFTTHHSSFTNRSSFDRPINRHSTNHHSSITHHSTIHHAFMHSIIHHSSITTHSIKSKPGKGCHHSMKSKSHWGCPIYSYPRIPKSRKITPAFGFPAQVWDFQPRFRTSNPNFVLKTRFWKIPPTRPDPDRPKKRNETQKGNAKGNAPIFTQMAISLRTSFIF